MRSNKQIIKAVERVRDILKLSDRNEILNTPREDRSDDQRRDMMAHAALDVLLKILNVMSTKQILGG